MARTDVLELVNTMKAKGEPFAIATVVRTVAVTAAKAGAKAIISPDGTISAGWIGGGCARGAVLRVATMRRLWDAQGVSQERQDELIADTTAKAQPGAKIGPFTLGGKIDCPPDGAYIHVYECAEIKP